MSQLEILITWPYSSECPRHGSIYKTFILLSSLLQASFLLTFFYDDLSPQSDSCIVLLKLHCCYYCNIYIYLIKFKFISLNFVLFVFLPACYWHILTLHFMFVLFLFCWITLLQLYYSRTLPLYFHRRLYILLITSVPVCNYRKFSMFPFSLYCYGLFTFSLI